MMSGGTLVLDMGKRNPLADAIMRQVRDHKLNYSVLISGRTQSRKSSTGLALALELDPTFDFEKDFAIIKTKDMLKVISAEGERRGKVKFLDEIGVGMDHHSWFQFFQKAMSHVLQTFGFEGKIIIATVPYQDYVNKDMLKLFNMYIEIIGKDENRKYSIARVFTLQYDERSKVLYRKYPRGVYPDKRVRRITSFHIHFPRQAQMDRYFAIANEQKKSLQYDVQAESDKQDASKLKQSFTPMQFVSEIMKRPSDFIKEYRGHRYVPVERIMNNFPGIGTKRANQIKDIAEAKLLGHEPDPVVEVEDVGA